MKKLILLPFLLSLIYTQPSFSSTTYFDYTYNLNQDENNNEFGLKRVYFTYQNILSKNISYKLQTDIDYKSSPIGIYLKNAKLDWKLQTGKLTFGMQSMNIFNVIEKTWGFRFLQKSAMDKYNFSSSADIGIAYSAKFNNLDYSIMYTNGSGYKQSENDKYKKTSIQIVYGEKELVKKNGFNIGLSFAIEPYETLNKKKNVMLMSLFSGYASNRLRIGGEFDRYRNDGSNITKQIVAAYACYKLSEKFEGIFYLDNYNPDKYNENNENIDLIIGASYKPEKGLTITPNIRISKPEQSKAITIFMVNFKFNF